MPPQELIPAEASHFFQLKIGALLQHGPDLREMPQNLISFAGSEKEEMVAVASFSQRT